ncbi:MAG: YciI family protein [Actinobacteria bacterium]|nr:YciI family protein [Actinomycetota bacterium]
MRYALLIYDEEGKLAQMTPEEGEAFQKAYGVFTEELKARGGYIAGEALQPTATATTVRVNGDDVLTTDGPFAETKEQLGGFYLVQAADLDQATRIASMIPSAKTGSIEIRPLMEFPEQP